MILRVPSDFLPQEINRDSLLYLKPAEIEPKTDKIIYLFLVDYIIFLRRAIVDVRRHDSASKSLDPWSHKSEATGKRVTASVTEAA